MAVNYGQVAIVPKGVWNAETQYKVNNLVEYDGSSYVAKVQPPVGTLPTDTSYWQVSAAGTKKATADSLGTVMPDGTTTEIKEDGKLSAKKAQQNALGVVKGSDDVTVGEDGNLTVNTTFEQATEIANIIAGEAIKSVLGKVSKAIATTMSLDENALLKNMISGIDVNDGNKVPSSAYIHSLVERIGMGTALEGGFDNLTAGLNSVNNNLSNANSQITQLYSELDSKIYGIPNKNIADLLDLSAPDGLYRVDPAAKNNPVGTYGICEVRTTDDKGWRFVTFYATSPANIVRRNFYNSYGTTNPVWSGWLADGLPIDFTDINIELSPEQWATSNNGLKYYNHTGWNIPSNALGVCANIMNWHGTSGNVTCSVYDNSYLQLRCEDAISWGGTIRVFYINSYIM